MPRKKPEPAEDNLAKLIKEYYSLDMQIKELTDRKESLNKTIKLSMRTRGITKFKADDLIASFTVHIRIKYYEDLAVKKLKSLGFTQAVKEIVDADAVKDLIKTGQISADILNSYMESKEVEILTIKKE